MRFAVAAVLFLISMAAIFAQAQPVQAGFNGISVFHGELSLDQSSQGRPARETSSYLFSKNSGSVNCAPRNRKYPAGVTADRINAAILSASQQTGVKPALLCGLINQESGFNPESVSGASAIGLTQLLASTALSACRSFIASKQDVYNVEKNVLCGAKYLRLQLDRFGSEKLALFAYNGGPGRARAYIDGKDIPSETLRYAPAVMAQESRYAQRGLA